MTDYTPLANPAVVTDQQWPEGTRPLVSILCVTYNHEHFIEDCLRGFLMQKTSFPVEIIVHDDASTDGTQRIVRQYSDEYPNLCRPIFQDKNQYSLGSKPSLLALQHARGDYVALCDGDDYWTNAEKLERQVAIFDEDPDVTICFHAAKEFDMTSGKTTVIGSPLQKDTMIVSLKEDYNVSVLLIEHDMSLVMGISDRINVISQGRPLAAGSFFARSATWRRVFS